MIDDDNLCFSFVWKPAIKPEIKFWMEREGKIFHCFFHQNGETFTAEAINGAELLADAITAAGLSEKDSERIFAQLIDAMRKTFH